MALRFERVDDKEIFLDQVRFNFRKSEFILYNKDELEVELKFNFCFEKNKSYSHLRDNHFEIFLLSKPEFASNDIYQIRYKRTTEASNGRLGYMIPLQSLYNSDHDYGENEHFSPYAYHVIRKLLNGDDNIPCKNLVIPATDFVDLEALYGENTHILVLYKPYVRVWEKAYGITFDINLFLPCLWSFGYLQMTISNFDEIYSGNNNDISFLKPEQNTLLLIPISKELNNDPYILNLFTSFLNSQKHELVRFHLLYQAIELLIEKVFQEELGVIIKDFSSQIDNFYDVKEKLTKAANEKARLEKLFTRYCENMNDELEALKNSCNELLSIIKPEFEQKSTALSLYKTRSLVFHSFRLLPQNYENHLREINTAFERLIIKTIQEFTLRSKSIKD